MGAEVVRDRRGNSSKRSQPAWRLERRAVPAVTLRGRKLAGASLGGTKLPPRITNPLGGDDRYGDPVVLRHDPELPRLQVSDTRPGYCRSSCSHRAGYGRVDPDVSLAAPRDAQPLRFDASHPRVRRESLIQAPIWPMDYSSTTSEGRSRLCGIMASAEPAPEMPGVEDDLELSLPHLSVFHVEQAIWGTEQVKLGMQGRQYQLRTEPHHLTYKPT
jgi:hypothetical protein